MDLDNATELMALAEHSLSANPKKLASLRRLYLALCAVLNQELEASRKWPYRAN